jgi:hypothetical protein
VGLRVRDLVRHNIGMPLRDISQAVVTVKIGGRKGGPVLERLGRAQGEEWFRTAKVWEPCRLLGMVLDVIVENLVQLEKIVAAVLCGCVS